jgi:drug/metabolite transporter (DMT)-like permease
MKLTKIGRKGMFALSLVAICIIFGAVGQILMKTGMSHTGPIGDVGKLLNPSTIASIFTNVYVIGGILLYAAASLLWLGALSTTDVSLMYPLLSLAYVVAAILSLIFLKEDVTLLRWVGIGVVIVGCFMILRS